MERGQIWAINPLFSISQYYTSSVSGCCTMGHWGWEQVWNFCPFEPRFPLSISHTLTPFCLFLLLIFSASHLSPFLPPSCSFSLPLYDYWKLYRDSARALRRVANAIGWLALHPHSRLAAGFNVGFNQLGGSVCRSVCSDVSLFLSLCSPPPPPGFGEPAVVLIGHVPTFKPRLEASEERGNKTGRLKEEVRWRKEAAEHRRA